MTGICLSLKLSVVVYPKTKVVDLLWCWEARRVRACFLWHIHSVFAYTINSEIWNWMFETSQATSWQTSSGDVPVVPAVSIILQADVCRLSKHTNRLLRLALLSAFINIEYQIPQYKFTYKKNCAIIINISYVGFCRFVT